MTREDVMTEMLEVQKDLDAFCRAKNAIDRRIEEMEGTERQKTFIQWAMSQVIINALIMARVRCEGLMEDYEKALDAMDVPDNVVHLVQDKGDQP